MSRLYASPFAFLALAAILSAACGGGPPPTMQGRSGMLSATAAAQKCEEAAKGHDRPFVVEWDATDLASFEAKAARDTVFVKYEGCKLDVLYQCSDPVTPGVFGAYGTPQFTSGTVQGFEVKNEGELYAKLPLGAANLSGRVQAGEQLQLKYFVSGVATTTRDALYQGEIAKASGCKGATHFVWAYNLGAFELLTAENNSVEAAGGAGGFGAGGKRTHEQKSVGAGGKMTACESQDQRGCRVPIRLALRAISEGDNPIGEVPTAKASTPASGEPAAAGGASAAGDAKQHWDDAKKKFEQGDGAGCLAAMNRALSFDLRLSDNHTFKTERAICVMAAGKCDEGKKDFRAALAAADIKREQQDWQLDRDTRKMSNRVCPSGGTTNDADFVLRADRELMAAAKVNDAASCVKLIDGIHARYDKLTQQLKGAPDFDVIGQAQSRAGNDYDIAAVCVAKGTKKCGEGLKQLQKQCSHSPMQDCKDIVAKSWKNTVERMKIDCR
ncbi:MAG: hypothetical protein KF764_11740 [Labilithrix sp.]|nr:hypothetical protein [Labilithrix sp.]